jgi:hypothetical protein
MKIFLNPALSACIYRNLLFTLTRIPSNPSKLPRQLLSAPLNFLVIVDLFHQVVFIHSKYLKMKRTLVIIALVCISAVGITSCSAQKGCKSTQGYVGYGNR